MKPSDPAVRHASVDYTQEIDGALAMLAAVRPRVGLEQRVLAGIASAPDLPWYRRFATVSMGHHRWALAAASAVIVAGGITMTTYSRHPVAAPTPVAVHTPRPAQQPAAAAASIGVSSHPMQMNKTKTRHRGVHKSYRAMHDRVPLPRGTAAPARPNSVPATQ
jgi:hypothetical protein